MKAEAKHVKNFLMASFACLYSTIWGQEIDTMRLSSISNDIVFNQTQSVKDTILFTNKNMIIEYPSVNRIKYDPYDEGNFKIISFPLDNALIIIHWGGMMALPITKLTDKTICSEFVLGNDVRSIRGYSIKEGEKRYFREDNYYKYSIDVI